MKIKQMPLATELLAFAPLTFFPIRRSGLCKNVEHHFFFCYTYCSHKWGVFRQLTSNCANAKNKHTWGLSTTTQSQRISTPLQLPQSQLRKVFNCPVVCGRESVWLCSLHPTPQLIRCVCSSSPGQVNSQKDISFQSASTISPRSLINSNP